MDALTKDALPKIKKENLHKAFKIITCVMQLLSVIEVI